MTAHEDFFQVGGTLADDAPSYVERKADSEILVALEKGELCLVLAPRQIGKSSLMVHARAKLLERDTTGGTRAAIVDLQPLGSHRQAEPWFGDMTYQIQRGLGLTTGPEWWTEHHNLGPTQRFMSFLEDVVLEETKGPVVLFIDEVDSVLKLPFSDDFFTTLRALYNARATNRKLRRLTFVLLGVTTPASFVKDRTRTPFNVGRSIRLDDFDKSSAQAFYDVLGESSANLVDRIFHWTGGHPFLVQDLAARAFAWTPEERTAERLDREVEEAYLRKRIERDTHLKFIHDYLLGADDVRSVLATYARILEGEEVDDDERSPVHTRLRLSGVAQEKDGKLRLRNRIYASVFDPAWIRESLAAPLRWNVPARNPYFTGREEILEALHGALTAEHRPVLVQAVAGLGGIGKTQIAIEHCHRHRDAYRAVFWLRAQSESEIRTSLLEVARLLELPEASEPATVEAVRRWLESNDGWLLVFDAADRPAALKPYLPRNVHGRILLTSRAAKFGAVGIREPLRVTTLSQEEGTELLLSRAERLDASAEERQAAAQLVGELGGLPLALEQAAAYVAARHTSFTSYLASWRQRHLALLEEAVPETGGYPASVATTWAMSFHDVTEESTATADLLSVLALLAPDAVPLELLEEGAAELGPALSETLGEDPSALARVLAPLLRYSLVEHDTERRTLSVHPMVQAVVRDRLDEPTERTWAERAVQALAGAFPWPEPETWPQCERLAPHVEVAAGLVERFSIETREAASLLVSTGHYLQSGGRYEAAEPLQRLALALYRKTLGDEHPDLAISLNNLASLLSDQGRYAEAEPLALEALTVFEKAFGSEHPHVATSVNNLGNLYENQGRHREAEPLLHRSLTIREKALGPDHPDVAASLHDLAGLYRAQDRYEEAEPLARRALEILEKNLGERHPDLSYPLNSLATLYVAWRRPEEAEPLFRRALALREENLGPEHPDVAASLNNLAVLCNRQSRYEEAEALYRRSLAVAEKTLGAHHPTTVQVRKNYAELLLATGRSAEVL